MLIGFPERDFSFPLAYVILFFSTYVHGDTSSRAARSEETAPPFARTVSFRRQKGTKERKERAISLSPTNINRLRACGKYRENNN